MKFEIKSWLNGLILFSFECESLKLCVEAAVKAGANLDGANLFGANLYEANLYGANLTRANLYGANLYGANLTRANLYGANLYGANLVGANLYEANLDGTTKLDDSTRLHTGETFAEYKRDVLPTLLTAGGKTIEEVAATWDCHEWSNCPMHAAFDFDGNYKNATPLIRAWRPRIDQFVKLFDAKQLPNPLGDSAAVACDVQPASELPGDLG